MRLIAEMGLLIVLAPATLVSLYLATLALLALLPARRRTLPATSLRRFAILIPAHNEESRILELLQSLAAMAYPSELVATTVVADNCDDHTAATARKFGAIVYERRSDVDVGKGYALAFGLTRIPRDYDAVVFVDADCTVSPNLLVAFNDRLDSGESAAQAYYTMTSSGQSGSRLVRELALTLVHLVRPLAKTHLGASAGLKGSGMCFSRAVVDRFGWAASGLAEDIEQHVQLVRSGLRVAFAPEATVMGAAPNRLADASGQHRRWEAGRISALREAPRLLAGAWRHRSFTMLDAAIELLVPPISVLGTGLLVLGFAAIGLDSTTALRTDAAGIAGLAFYILVGLVFVRPRPSDLARLIAWTPIYAAWKLLVWARAVFAPAGRWDRTVRESDLPPPPYRPSGAG